MTNKECMINQLKSCMKKRYIRRHFTDEEVNRFVKDTTAEPLTDEQVEVLAKNCEEYELFYAIVDPERGRKELQFII